MHLVGFIIRIKDNYKFIVVFQFYNTMGCPVQNLSKLAKLIPSVNTEI